MNKKTIICLISCMIFSVLVVLGLSRFSHRIVHTKGSFLRAFRQHAIEEHLDLDLKFNSYYIAGEGQNTLYMGNYSAPLHAVSMNLSTGDTVQYSIDAEGISDDKFWSIRLKVDSPNFYLCDGAVPRIYKGTINNWKGKRFEYDREFFQDIEPIGANSFAVRSLVGKENNASLGKFSIQEPHYTFKPEILKKQVDGYFCTSGYLRYDKSANRLIYLYRYRNEYIIMDSALRVLSKSTTIDTNSVAKIEVATIRSSASRQFQSPPLIVNDKCSVSKNYLFVNSAIVSRNESDDALKDASVIDVYSLRDNKYKFSFYIFNHRSGEKLREFKVAGDNVIALYQTRLLTYNIDKTYFPDR